jgi:hypothetical protein
MAGVSMFKVRLAAYLLLGFGVFSSLLVTYGIIQVGFSNEDLREIGKAVFPIALGIWVLRLNKWAWWGAVIDGFFYGIAGLVGIVLIAIYGLPDDYSPIGLLGLIGLTVIVRFAVVFLLLHPDSRALFRQGALALETSPAGTGAGERE